MALEICILVFAVDHQVCQVILSHQILPVALWWIEIEILSNFFLLLFYLHIKQLLNKYSLAWVALVIETFHDLLFVFSELLNREVL